MECRLGASLLLLTLAACASAPPAPSALPDAGPEPTAAQAEDAIRAYLGTALKDPESVKQFAITRGPYQKTYRALITMPWRNGWIVCFQYNAKNSYGGYVGVRPAAVAIHGDLERPYVIEPLPDFGLNLYC